MSKKFKGVSKQRSLCIFKVNKHPYFDTKDTVNNQGKEVGSEKMAEGRLVFLSTPLSAYVKKLQLTVATDENIKQVLRSYNKTQTYLDKDGKPKSYTNLVEVFPSGGNRQNFFQLNFKEPIEFEFPGRFIKSANKKLPDKKIKLVNIRIPYPTTGVIVKEEGDKMFRVVEKGVPINLMVIRAIIKAMPKEIKDKLYSLSINGNRAVPLAVPKGARTKVEPIKSIESK